MGIADEKTVLPASVLQRILRFFAPLANRDRTIRVSITDTICEVFRTSAIKGDLYPTSVSNETGSTEGGDQQHQNGCGIGYGEQHFCLCAATTMQHYLPIILMHSLTCPCEEVRIRFQQLLENLKVSNVFYPYSEYNQSTDPHLVNCFPFNGSLTTQKLEETNYFKDYSSRLNIVVSTMKYAGI